jgi:hypothetical protein
VAERDPGPSVKDNGTPELVRGAGVSKKRSARAANITLERNRAACGLPGLNAGELSVVRRLPWAFAHVPLLEGAARLTGRWGLPWPR